MVTRFVGTSASLSYGARTERLQNFARPFFFSRFTLTPCATSQTIEELSQSTYETNKRITNDNSKIDSCILNNVNDGGFSFFLSSFDFSFYSYCPFKKNGIFVFLFTDLLFPRHFLKHLNIVGGGWLLPLKTDELRGCRSYLMELITRYWYLLRCSTAGSFAGHLTDRVGPKLKNGQEIIDCFRIGTS